MGWKMLSTSQILGYLVSAVLIVNYIKLKEMCCDESVYVYFCGLMLVANALYPGYFAK